MGGVGGGANLHRVQIICTTSKVGANLHRVQILKTPFTSPKYTWVQIVHTNTAFFTRSTRDLCFKQKYEEREYCFMF